jgi:hypothetical protein
MEGRVEFGSSFRGILVSRHVEKFDGGEEDSAERHGAERSDGAKHKCICRIE